MHEHMQKHNPISEESKNRRTSAIWSYGDSKPRRRITSPVLGVGLLISMFALGIEAAAEGVDVKMIAVEGTGRHYWPRWRGPSGQGLVEGEGYPNRWSDTENVVWKKAVPGRGNSSPIIWGDRIFLTTAYENGRRRSLLCFRRSDGSQTWETFLPEAEAEKAYQKNGHASSTPATDGELIYAYLGNHGLMAVDLEGKLVWHRTLGDLTSAYHGTAGSPLLYQDKVILFQELRQGSSFLAAFNKKTGEELWRTSRQGGVGWGSPVAIRVGGHDEIIMSSHRQVYSYDPLDGGVLWHCAGNTVEVIPTPVVGQGLVFCSSGRAGPTLAIRPGGSGDVSSTRLVWRAVKGSPFVPSPLIHGEYLYLMNDMISIVTCYHARTGKVVWQGRLGKPVREGFSASPVAVGDKIFFTNDTGQTFVLRMGPEFQLLHVNDLQEQVLASPALVDGHWYFRAQKHLLAIGLE